MVVSLLVLLGFVVLIIALVSVIRDNSKTLAYLDKRLGIEPTTRRARRNDRKTHLPPGPISIRIACRSSQKDRREKERRMRG